MTNIENIQQFFPENIRRNEYKEYMLKEYLQYQILDIIFNSRYAGKLSFIGGSNLRILHNFRRFSEDLDFDNFNLKKEEFNSLVKNVVDTLMSEGYNIEVREKKSDVRTAFQKYLHFPGLMFEQGLSPHKEKRFFIKIDSESQNYFYTPQKSIIQKFDVITPVFHPALDIMLSMKIKTFFDRRKSRDCFDIMHLFSLTTPDFEFLKKKLSISNKKELREKMLERCKDIDFNHQVNDIKPFLFNIRDARKIIMFPELLKKVLKNDTKK